MPDELSVKIDVLLGVKEGEVKNIKAQLEDEKINVPVNLDVKGTDKVDKKLSQLQQRAQKYAGEIRKIIASVPEIDKTFRGYTFSSGKLRDAKSEIRGRLALAEKELTPYLRQLESPDLTVDQLKEAQKASKKVLADIYRAQMMSEMASVGKMLTQGDKAVSNAILPDEERKKLKKNLSLLRKDYNKFFDTIDEKAKKIAVGKEDFYALRTSEFASIGKMERVLEKIPQEIAIAANITPAVDQKAIQTEINSAVENIKITKPVKVPIELIVKEDVSSADDSSAISSVVSYNEKNFGSALKADEKLRNLYGKFQDDYEDLVQQFLMGEEDEEYRQKAQSLIQDVINNRKMEPGKLLQAIRDKYNKDGSEFNIGKREIGKILTFANHLENKFAPALEKTIAKIETDLSSRVQKSAIALQHTIDPENLLKASKTNGLIAPSGAVFNTSHVPQLYGNVGLFFDGATFDPRLHQDSHLFGADGNTPVVGNLKTRKIRKQDGTIETQLYSELEKAWLPFTAENAANIMRNEYPLVNLPGHFGKSFDAPEDFEEVGESLKQAFIKRYANFDELLADSDRLLDAVKTNGGIKDAGNIDADQHKAYAQKYREIQTDILNAMGKDAIDSVDPQIFKAVTDAIVSDTSPMLANENEFVSSLQKSFDETGIQLNNEIIQKLVSLRNSMANNLADYFEAKIMRDVGIEEARAAVVPRNVDPAVRQELTKRNIPIYEYEYTELPKAKDFQGDQKAYKEAFVRINEANERAYLEAVNRVIADHPELNLRNYKTKLPPIAADSSKKEAEFRKQANDLMARFTRASSEEIVPKVDPSEIENAGAEAKQLSNTLANLEGESTHVHVNADEVKTATKEAERLLALPAPQYEELSPYQKPSAEALRNVDAIYDWTTYERALEPIWNKMRDGLSHPQFIPIGGRTLQDLVDNYRTGLQGANLLPDASGSIGRFPGVGTSSASIPVDINVDPDIHVNNPVEVKEEVKKVVENATKSSGSTKAEADVEIETNVEIADPHGMMNDIKAEIEKNKKLVDDISEMPRSIMSKQQADNRVSQLQQNIKHLEHLQNVLQQTGNMLPDNYESIFAQSRKLQEKAFKNIHLETFEQQGDKLKNMFSEITQAMGSLHGDKDFSNLFDAASNSLQVYSDQYAKVLELSKQGNLTGEDIASLNKAYVQAAHDVEAYAKAVKDASKAEEKQTNAAKKNQAAMETAKTKIQEMLELQKKYEKAFKDPAWAQSYNNILAGYQAIGPDTENAADRVASLNKQLAALKAQARAAGTATTTFGTSLEKAFSRFGRWFSASEIFMFIVNKTKEMIGNVKAIDSAMTDLRKVTDASEGQYDKYLTSAAQRSADMSARITGYIGGTNQFARLGYGIEDAQKLGEVATIYAQVGDDIQGIEDASSSIIATMKAFDIEADNAMSIVDKFNRAGNAYAVSSGNIGAMLQRSAAAMASAGNDINQTIAMGTAMAEVNRDAEKSGAALKVLALRLRGSKTELEEMGESTETMATSTSKLREQILALTNVDGTGGFDIMDADGFKSTYEMIDGIANAFNKMDDGSENAAALLELIAGKNRASDVAGMMKNWETAKNVYKDMLNAEGSAMEEYEKWQKSIEAKSEKLGSNFERMSVAVFDTEVLSAFYNILNSILSVFSGIAEVAGGIPTIVGLAFAALAKIKPDSGIVKVQYAPLMKNSLAA